LTVTKTAERFGSGINDALVMLVFLRNVTKQLKVWCKVQTFSTVRIQAIPDYNKPNVYTIL